MKVQGTSKVSDKRKPTLPNPTRVLKVRLDRRDVNLCSYRGKIHVR